MQSQSLVDKLKNKYRISQGHSTWLQYRRKDPHVNIKLIDKNKVHFSFDQTMLEVAKPIILTILERHSVYLFKLIHEAKEYGKKRSNIFGKELTIYMQIGITPENDSSFWLLIFNELEDELSKAGVKPSPDNFPLKPLGDKLFPGSIGYIHYRYPDNIFEQYMSAKNLSWLGFTNQEASEISDETIFERMFENQALHDNFKQKEESQQTVNTELAITADLLNKNEIDQEQWKDIYQHYVDEIPRYLKTLIYGNGANKDALDKYEKYTNLLIITLRFNFKIYEDKYNVDEHTREIIITLEKYVLSILEKLSREVSILRQAIDIDPKTEIGLIMPVIYLYIIFPIMKLWKENASLPINEIIKNLEINENKFLEELVKCSFRKRPSAGFSQLECESPQYIDNLSENTILALHRCYQQSLSKSKYKIKHLETKVENNSIEIVPDLRVNLLHKYHDLCIPPFKEIIECTDSNGNKVFASIRPYLGAISSSLLTGELPNQVNGQISVANINLDNHGLHISIHDIAEAKRLKNILKDKGFNIQYKQLKKALTTPYGVYHATLTIQDPLEIQRYIEQICGVGYKETNDLYQVCRQPLPVCIINYGKFEKILNAELVRRASEEKESSESFASGLGLTTLWNKGKVITGYYTYEEKKSAIEKTLEVVNEIKSGTSIKMILKMNRLSERDYGALRDETLGKNIHAFLPFVDWLEQEMKYKPSLRKKS